jgi:hypothetical protein
LNRGAHGETWQNEAHIGAKYVAPDLNNLKYTLTHIDTAVLEGAFL